MAQRIAHTERKWRSEDVKTDREHRNFLFLIQDSRILSGLRAAGFRKPSPVQVRAIPEACLGKDLIVQSKSGTGKTCFFVIRALDCLSIESKQLQVLIIVPTREIASQIKDVVLSIGVHFENLACEIFIGGTPVVEDVDKLHGCQIAVGTPGRVGQLISEEHLHTRSIKLLILDEADKLMTLPFSGDVNYIIDNLPIERQTLAVSATFMDILSDHHLDLFFEKNMRAPKVICVYEEDIALKGVLQFYHVVDKYPTIYQNKFEMALKILNSISFSQCLVFSSSLSEVQTLCTDLKNNRHAVASITSQDNQETRLQTMNLLKEAKIKVLVTSDLSSRGIDAENVNLVLHMDHAINLRTYLNRVGRAGRYGSRGVSIVMVTNGRPAYQLLLYRIQAELTLYPLPDPMPYYLKKYEPASPELANEILKYDIQFKHDRKSCNVNLGIEEENKISTDIKIIEMSNDKDVQNITNKGDSIMTPDEIMDSVLSSFSNLGGGACSNDSGMEGKPVENDNLPISSVMGKSAVVSSVFSQKDGACSNDNGMKSKKPPENGNLPISTVMGKSDVSVKIEPNKKAFGEKKGIKDFNPKEPPKESQVKSQHKKSPKGAIEESDFRAMEQRFKQTIHEKEEHSSSEEDLYYDLNSSSKSRPDHPDGSRLSHHHQDGSRLSHHHQDGSGLSHHHQDGSGLSHHHQDGSRLSHHHHQDGSRLSHHHGSRLSHHHGSRLSHHHGSRLSHHHQDGSRLSHHHQDGSRLSHHHQDGSRLSHHHQDGSRLSHHHQDGSRLSHHQDGSRLSHHHQDGSRLSHHHQDGSRLSHHQDGSRLSHHHQDGSRLSHHRRDGGGLSRHHQDNTMLYHRRNSAVPCRRHQNSAMSCCHQNSAMSCCHQNNAQSHCDCVCVFCNFIPPPFPFL